jgi:para-aminobenzoate synthetase component 1
MDYGRQTLDFEGQRIVGQEPLGHLESWGELSFWNDLRARLSQYAVLYPQGGAIGFIGYEATEWLERRAFPTPRSDDLNLPRARLVFYKSLQREAVPASLPLSPPELIDLPDDSWSKHFYENGVTAIKEYIAAGDIYQANLTQRISVETTRTAPEIYNRLQQLGRAPRAALLEWSDFSIISNSPETFLTLKSGILEARPIKGTIARGATPKIDEHRKMELANSAKNKAENVMIVDLMRNDLGKVCEFGTVHVRSLYQIETFPTLHHGVSVVQGRLRHSCDAMDAFLAAFPCGSITGAPKMRAMQILNSLEPLPRGASMGAIGYFGFNGDMEWSVAIRTATLIGRRATFHVGGGIVTDSEPESEYEEMRLKARALYSAIS